MKSSFSTTAAAVLMVTSAAVAQNSSALPFAACLQPCDEKALAAVGCTAADLLCHCEKAHSTFEILVPCVLNNSTCGADATTDLLNFGTFAAGTCVPFNITPPAISDFFPNSTTSTNSTTTSPGANTTGVVGTPTPTPSVYAGVADRVQAGVWGVFAGAVGLAFAL